MLILACVDAHGVFTYLNTGNLGQVGDATTFNTSRLPDKVSRQKWLGLHLAIVDEVELSPYLVWDFFFFFFFFFFTIEHILTKKNHKRHQTRTDQTTINR